MTITNSLFQALSEIETGRAWQLALSMVAWTIGPCISADLLGYCLHRLLNSYLISTGLDN